MSNPFLIESTLARISNVDMQRELFDAYCEAHAHRIYIRYGGDTISLRDAPPALAAASIERWFTQGHMPVMVLDLPPVEFDETPILPEPPL